MGKDGLDLLARQIGDLDAVFGHLLEHRLLLTGCVCVGPIIQRVTKFLREFLVNFARVFVHGGSDFRRQQRSDDAVLVRAPHGTVATQEGRAGALLTRKAEMPLQKTIDKVLEAYGNFVKRSVEPGGNPIDHAAADRGLAHRNIFAPLGTMSEEVANASCQIVIGGQQSPAPGHDAVPVMIGVAGKSDIEFILQYDEGLHRVLRGRIHADPSVPVQRHETEGRIDNIIHQGEI